MKNDKHKLIKVVRLKTGIIVEHWRNTETWITKIETL
jgi:hypothetical protein